MLETITKMFELLLIPLVAVLGFLWKKIQRVEERISDSYSKDEAQEMMDGKVEPIYKDQQNLKECLERVHTTLDKLNSNLDELRLKDARREGERKAKDR